MEEKNITEKESLLIIQQMIHTAKKEQKDDGKGWIIWGWLIFLSSLFTYLNLQWRWFESTFLFWNLFGFLSLGLLMWSVVKSYFGDPNDRVTTYTKDLFKKLNIGFVISLMLIITSMNVGGVDPKKGFALLLGLYGFWIMIYGAVLSFRPSIIGAYVTWAFAFGSLFVTSFEHTMLLHAAAVLCGYIIPGHIANKEFNKSNVEAVQKRV